MQTNEENTVAASYPNTTYAWYVVVLLMFFYVLSFMDRQIIAVLIEPIKADLDLSDVQMSLLGGLSFTIFYSTAGVFVGRLADSLNRPLVIAAGVFVWSLTTALCGLAGKFWQLLILRMGVGLGESALLPSTLSLLTDYFPAHRRATPTSVFLLGAPFGIGLSFAAGGYLLGVAEKLSAADGWADVILVGGTAAWQLVLLFLGVLGMLMTLALWSVREPRNMNLAASGKKKQVTSRAASLEEVKDYARKNWVPISALYIGMALISLAAYAQGFWDITFLSRTYDLNPTEITFAYGMVQLFGGFSGMLAGGLLADRLTKRGMAGASMVMVVAGAAIATPFSFIYPLADSTAAALTFMVLAIFGSNMAFACAASALQRVFPGSMIGLGAGIYYFISNAVGIGVGPTAVAAITDYLYQDPEMIRYSLAAVSGISRALAFVVVLAGLKSYKDLVLRVELKHD